MKKLEKLKLMSEKLLTKSELVDFKGGSIGWYCDNLTCNPDTGPACSNCWDDAYEVCTSPGGTVNYDCLCPKLDECCISYC